MTNKQTVKKNPALILYPFSIIIGSNEIKKPNINMQTINKDL